MTDDPLKQTPACELDRDNKINQTIRERLRAQIERLTADNERLTKAQMRLSAEAREQIQAKDAEIERLKADKAGWEVEGFIDRLTRRNDANSERLVAEAISHLRGFSRDCDALRESNQELRAEIERLTTLLKAASYHVEGEGDVSLLTMIHEALNSKARKEARKK